jgi:tRNA(His) guanylyltransferase
LDKDSIGNRMKENYENRYRIKLTRRMPVIMRLDGKAFHTLTRGMERPYSKCFRDMMVSTALELLKEIQGSKCAYVQSDEISILIIDFDKLTTDAWFDYNIQKMVSVSAGIASATFTRYIDKIGIFDSRVFNIPKEEVCNYFIWRQQDWVRNSIQMLAQHYFSAKELHGKNQPAMHEMLYTKNVNWADQHPRWKNGTFLNVMDGGILVDETIIFTQNRDVIENYLIPIEQQPSGNWHLLSHLYH